MTLAEHIRAEGIQEGLQQGLQQGKKQGIQQGLHEGEAALLIRLLTRKFGPLPTNYQQRIQQANPEMLLIWGEQLLEAKTLAEVFH